MTVSKKGTRKEGPLLKEPPRSAGSTERMRGGEDEEEDTVKEAVGEEEVGKERLASFFKKVANQGSKVRPNGPL